MGLASRRDCSQHRRVPSFLPAHIDLDRETYAPVVLDPARAEQRRAIVELVAGGVVVADTFAEQVLELVMSREPARTWTLEERELALATALGEHPEELGRWVHYPWSNRLVHLLGPEDFVELRCDRNRNKITRSEQRALRARTIGVVGLSVGQSSAVTLAMEGVGGRFRLADFDRLSLSNMNRLRAGVHDLGVKKTVLAAREMFEIDPYLDVRIWSDGLAVERFEEFFLDGPVDLLVEECDDLYLKVALREYARERRIPVLMETSDRGLLEVERFDLEPARPLLHGLLSDVSAETLRTLTTKEKVPYVLRVYDKDVLSPRMCASLVEVKESIFAWPQLASAVTLGGALVTDVARRILLGAFTASGRFSVDLERLVSAPTAASVAEPPPLAPEVVPEAAAPRRLCCPSARGEGAITDDEIAFLLECASLAPSAGNTQPWLFRPRPAAGGPSRAVDVNVDPAALPSVEHYGAGATLVAFGAVRENLRVGAVALGLQMTCDVGLDLTGRGPVFSVTFDRVGPRSGDGVEVLANRVTNRRLGDGRPLEPRVAEALRQAALDAGGEVVLFTHRPELERLGELLGRGDQACLLSRPLHRQLFTEIRWSPREVLASRDGIDLASMELTPTDAAALRVLGDWPTVELVREWDGGRGLRRSARSAVAASSALALVRAPGRAPATYLDGGGVAQRVWHEATELGLAVQPWSALLFLFPRLEGNELALEPKTRDALRGIESELRVLAPEREGWSDVFLMRLAYASPPTARSLRRAPAVGAGAPGPSPSERAE